MVTTLLGGPKMIMKNYVADELSNKVYHLTMALEKANEIIKRLEEQNQSLEKAFGDLYCDKSTAIDSVETMTHC
jgi:hypothetical protein